jgi:DNA-binding XRE family transcriptional regulator
MNADDKVKEQLRAIMRDLREARIAREMTQGMAAEAIGAHRINVNRWECGDPPKMSNLAALADLLGYEIKITIEPKRSDDELL